MRLRAAVALCLAVAVIGGLPETTRARAPKPRPRTAVSNLSKIKAIQRQFAKDPSLKRCATYLRVNLCYIRKMPKAARAPAIAAAAKTAEAYLKMSKGPGKEYMAKGCGMALSAWAQAVRKMPKYKSCLRGVKLPKNVANTTEPDDGHSEFCMNNPLETKCPAGTTALGARPPRGHALWCVDRRRQKHGVWTWWYQNGKLREQIEYTKGKRNGITKSWSSSGVILSEVNYKKGKLHGSWTSCFTKKGFHSRAKWAGKFANGKRTGVWSKSSLCWAGVDTGFKKTTLLQTGSITYRRGLKHGPAKNWACETQKVSSEGKYRNGKKHGAWISYPTSSEGTGENWLKEVTRYKNGVMHGLYELYGGLKFLEKGKYARDKKTGVWKTWWENGKKKSTCKYARSKRHGKESIWRKHGQRLSVTHYRNGVKHGTETLWHANGRKRSKTTFRKGTRHGRRMLWNDKGTVTSNCKYTNGVQSKCRT